MAAMATFSPDVCSAQAGMSLTGGGSPSAPRSPKAPSTRPRLT